MAKKDNNVNNNLGRLKPDTVKSYYFIFFGRTLIKKKKI